jgi:hypothetical protein
VVYICDRLTMELDKGSISKDLLVANHIPSLKNIQDKSQGGEFARPYIFPCWIRTLDLYPRCITNCDCGLTLCSR